MTRPEIEKLVREGKWVFPGTGHERQIEKHPLEVWYAKHPPKSKERPKQPPVGLIIVMLWFLFRVFVSRPFSYTEVIGVFVIEWCIDSAVKSWWDSLFPPA